MGAIDLIPEKPNHPTLRGVSSGQRAPTIAALPTRLEGLRIGNALLNRYQSAVRPDYSTATLASDVAGPPDCGNRPCKGQRLRSTAPHSEPRRQSMKGLSESQRRKSEPNFAKRY
jgi:hypothetical protein